MAKLTYEQAFDDHSYLWEVYGSANDMTGGYVDQEDLTKLLRSPTKATARDCLESQIRYWFQVGPDHHMGSGYNNYSAKELIEKDSNVRDIAVRYNIIDDDYEDEE